MSFGDSPKIKAYLYDGRNNLATSGKVYDQYQSNANDLGSYSGQMPEVTAPLRFLFGDTDAVNGANCKLCTADHRQWVMIALESKVCSLPIY